MSLVDQNGVVLVDSLQLNNTTYYRGTIVPSDLLKRFSRQLDGMSMVGPGCVSQQIDGTVIKAINGGACTSRDQTSTQNQLAPRKESSWVTPAMLWVPVIACAGAGLWMARRSLH